MRKLLSTFVILFYLFQNSYAQLHSFEISKTDTANLSADIYGMLYLSSKNNLFKFNPQNKECLIYSGKQSQNFSAAEVSDPFKIIIYDKNFREFLFFDKQLKLLSNTKLQLPNDFFKEPLFVRNNQALYIFNTENRELYKYTLNFQFIEKYYLQELQSSQTVKLLAADNNLFFLSENRQIFIFNSEAVFIGSHSVSDFETGEVSNPVFIQIDNNTQEIQLRNPISKTCKTVKIHTPAESIKAAAVHKDLLFYISKHNLHKVNLNY